LAAPNILIIAQLLKIQYSSIVDDSFVITTNYQGLKLIHIYLSTTSESIFDEQIAHMIVFLIFSAVNNICSTYYISFTIYLIMNWKKRSFIVTVLKEIRSVLCNKC